MGHLLKRLILAFLFLGAMKIVASCIQSYDTPAPAMIREPAKEEQASTVKARETSNKPIEIQRLESKGFRFLWTTDVEGFDGAWMDGGPYDGWSVAYYPEVDGVAASLSLTMGGSNIDAAAVAHFDFFYEFGINIDMIMDLGDEALDYRKAGMQCDRNWCCDAAYEDSTLAWACVPD